MIKLAKKASNKLKGTAKTNSPTGSTLIFQITIHINTKPANQDRKVVWSNENFFDIMNIAIAKHNDQIPQTALLIGPEGNTSPSFS